MSGEFIKVVHRCDMPDATAQGIGSVWRCDCGKEWTSYYVSGYGGYTGWRWSNRPPVIYQTTPTKWQRLVAFINKKGK